jgi:hypothetical protein
MNLLRASLREIVGLFVDDQFLAVAALVVVCAVTLLIEFHVITPLAAGGVLFAGCLGALLTSVWRAANAGRK